MILYISFVVIEERIEVEYKGFFIGLCLIFWNCKNSIRVVCGNCMEYCKVFEYLIFYILSIDICIFVFVNMVYDEYIFFKNNVYLWLCVLFVIKEI